MLASKLLTLFRADIGPSLILDSCISSRHRRCLVEKASVDEVYLDITEEVHSLMKETTPDSFLREILMPVTQSKVAISLNPQPPSCPEASEQEDGSEEADEETDPEKDIHNIFSHKSSLTTALSDPQASSGFASPMSPEEWLSRPLSAWYSDAIEREQQDKEQDRLLICASFLVTQIRKDVFDRLGFTCSAGIAHTKLIAKVDLGLPRLLPLIPLRWHQQ
jgi:nucleotidyltransferase/DNA polymerase involved in DNA repair